MFAKKLRHKMAGVFRMTQNVGIQKRKRLAIRIVFTLCRASSVPIVALARNVDSFSVIFVLLMAKAIRAFDEAFSVDVAFVPAFVDALIAVSVRTSPDYVIGKSSWDRVFRCLWISSLNVDIGPEENFLARFWFSELKSLRQLDIVAPRQSAS